jgi:hypothetical protein
MLKIDASAQVEKFIFAHFFADGTLGRAWPRLRAERIGHRFFFGCTVTQEASAERNRGGSNNNENRGCLIHRKKIRVDLLKARFI